MHQEREVDVLVVGSGGGGLTAGLCASKAGADVLLTEKSSMIGGTTAISSGALWVPCNRKQSLSGLFDSKEEVLRYLKRVTLGVMDLEKVKAFLDTGRDMLDYLEKSAAVQFSLCPSFVDYHPEWEGARLGRTLEPEPFEGASLGDFRSKLRTSRILPRLTLREVKSGGFSKELLQQRESGDILTLGTALAGSLLKACLDAGVEAYTDSPAVDLIVSSDRVVGAKILRKNRTVEVFARRSVILASGGFEWNEEMKSAFLSGPDLAPASPPHNTGDGLKMSLKLSPALCNMADAWWTPCIRVPGETVDGASVSRSIVAERARGGSIMVNKRGERFCNESRNYDDVGRIINSFDPSSYTYPNMPCYLLFDESYRRRYGFLTAAPRGRVPPWLTKAASVKRLAKKLGIPASTLLGTISRFNVFAKLGKDLDYHRGESAYDLYFAPEINTPNPCLAQLRTPPYYAVEVLPGSLGTRGGLRTNAKGQVLRSTGEIIKGLYAVGNVASSIFGRGYPGAGAALGPILTFAYIAGRSAA